MRWLRLLALAAVLAAAACVPSTVTTTTATTAATTTTTSTTTSTIPIDTTAGPTAAPVRTPVTGRLIYFVMTDRFENGDPSNDTGGVEGGPLDNGFLPEDTGYYHGGDLAGLTAELPYIAGMGVGAIWITPPFKNKYVQGNGTVEGSSAGYHGYWQIDWDHVDPHLGSDQDLEDFVQAAHDLGMLVFFDIVVNHTADVIEYADGSYVYYSMAARPYLDAGGNEFDPTAVADTDAFPPLDPNISFPHIPTFATPEDATIKSPAWLNDVTMYHNRGNSTFTGESNTFGDFFGLDDLFTENPAVLRGMTDLQASLITRYDIDGFRIDTMRHVNIEFWQEFAPAIKAAAAAAGKPDFFFFGEVSGGDPILESSFTNVGVPATLDFVVDAALDQYVAGRGSGSQLADAFDSDDWLTDADNNASMQVKFFGNHDEGRMGYFIDTANPNADDDTLLARMKLGFDLLFLTRGEPVVYYGDEQGFVGTGGDQLARQDMFPSVTPEYMDDDDIGSNQTPADDNFDTTHPIYRYVTELQQVRADNPTLVTGAQIVHELEGPLFAFSRFDRDERIEYVVVTNTNGSITEPARVTVLSPNTTFRELRSGDPVTVMSDANGSLLVQVPPISTVILRADTPLPLPDAPTTIDLVHPKEGAEIPTFRYRLEAELGDTRYAEVTFAVAVDGGEPQIIGVDDAAPYRVYWDTTSVPDGTPVEIIATVDDGSGYLRSSHRTVTMGAR
jgi:glycosidase